MKIHPEQRLSDVTAVNSEATSVSLTADHPIVGTLQVSDNGLYFDNLSQINTPCPLPKTIFNYKFFRISVADPVPYMRNITVNQSVPGVAEIPEDFYNPDFIKTRSRHITRDEAGLITQIEFINGRTVNYTYGEDDTLISYTDGVYTWTIVRDDDGNITEMNVTENED